MAHEHDDLDDAALIARFEALDVPPASFRHRVHVRLAFAMLARADFAAGAARFCGALQRYVAAFGAEAKYHETITWAYLVLVHQRMSARAYASSLELLADNPDLLDHRTGALARHYDVAAITASPVARRVFVLPERA
jgi:hypothetical protein